MSYIKRINLLKIIFRFLVTGDGHNFLQKACRGVQAITLSHVFKLRMLFGTPDMLLDSNSGRMRHGEKNSSIRREFISKLSQLSPQTRRSI